MIMEGLFDIYSTAQLYSVRWGLLAILTVFAAIVIAAIIFAVREIKDDTA